LSAVARDRHLEPERVSRALTRRGPVHSPPHRLLAPEADRTRGERRDIQL